MIDVRNVSLERTVLSKIHVKEKLNLYSFKSLFWKIVRLKEVHFSNVFCLYSSIRNYLLKGDIIHVILLFYDYEGMSLISLEK